MIHRANVGVLLITTSYTRLHIASQTHKMKVRERVNMRRLRAQFASMTLWYTNEGGYEIHLNLKIQWNEKLPLLWLNRHRKFK